MRSSDQISLQHFDWPADGFFYREQHRRDSLSGYVYMVYVCKGGVLVAESGGVFRRFGVGVGKRPLIVSD